MELINQFVILIVIICSIFTMLCIIVTLFFRLLERPLTLFDYKITNICYTIFYSIVYISFFIIFLYSLRIYNINRFVDLKQLLSTLIMIFDLLKCLPVQIKIFFGIFSILSSVAFLSLLLLLHKFFKHEIFKLYLYFVYNENTRFNNEMFIFNYLQPPYKLDIISYSITKFCLYTTKRYFFFKNNLSWKDGQNPFSLDYTKLQRLFLDTSKKRSRFHYTTIIFKIIYSKWYNHFITISPIFIIIYDCIFNDFILIHIYYYLILYVPLILYRSITIALCTENNYICQLIWDILYKKETCIYALPINHKKLFDLYLSNGIKSVVIDPRNAEMDLDISIYLKNVSRFIYNSQTKSYQNLDATEIPESHHNLIQNLIIVNEWKDQEIEEKQWIIIAIKFHTKNFTLISKKHD